MGGSSRPGHTMTGKHRDPEFTDLMTFMGVYNLILHSQHVLQPSLNFTWRVFLARVGGRVGWGGILPSAAELIQTGGRGRSS